ncbi:prolipoprotein diacylglyceryl transferase [Candidatus Peregrinibacteria bacterium]|nr:prolipoprotein diacylglyceryl transferase [Candidatus Peregrinibacteria bacterium]
MITFFSSRTVALTFLGFPVHWYGLLYLAGFLLGFWMVQKLQKYRSLTLSRDEWGNILSAAVIGVILGGRLGFVFFYQPTYFLENPHKIFALWEGGMSSHGGFIGVTAALLVALRHQRANILRIADIIVIPVAIGLALGRFGNFINMELYGTVTDLQWGIAIPGVEGLRHPTFFYAMGKDMFIALLCFLHLRATSVATDVAGRTCSLFLILYGILRFLIEYVRVQEYSLIDTGVLLLSRGQLLTFGILLAGVWLWGKTRVNPTKHSSMSC